MTVPSEEIKGGASGPPIHVHFVVNHSQVTSIQISLAESFGYTVSGKKLEEVIAAWMEAYRQGKKGPPLPLDLSPLTPFTRKGLKAIAAIPIGQVNSYGEIASQIGCPKGARAIGNICNKNPFPLVIPCHRVIHGSGSLGGFAYNIEIKKSLLSHENSSIPGHF